MGFGGSRLTGGYAVARNAVATGYHCTDPSQTPMRNGYLIAVGSDGTVHVSTEWAPGSSGAAVLDLCGNAIGHVANISPLTEKGHFIPAKPPETKPGEELAKIDPQISKPATADRFQGAVLITMHIAIPARGVLGLVQSLKLPPEPKTRQ